MKINEENIEAYLLDFAEGNLNDESEVMILQSYLDANPEYKSLLSEYDESIKLEDDENLIFKNKEKFYHKPKFPIRKYILYSLGSAAALLLLILNGNRMLNPHNSGNTDNTEQQLALVKDDTEENKNDREQMEIKKPLPEKQNSTKQNVKEYHPLQKVYTQKDNKTINDENASQPSVTNKQEYSTSYEQPEYLAQNTVEIIKEVNNLPQDMDTVKIIYVKSKKQPQRNSFFHYVGQRTMNYIQERRQQRQEYTF